jgi:hypothetical protein
VTHQSFTPKRWNLQELECLRESLLGLLEDLTFYSSVLQVITNPEERKTLELAHKLLQWTLGTFLLLLEVPAKRVGLVPLDWETVCWLVSKVDLREGDSK